MSVQEIKKILNHMTGTTRLMAELIYDNGMRINECMTLRVKDIDFDSKTLSIKAGKGDVDRTSILSDSLTNA